MGFAADGYADYNTGMRMCSLPDCERKHFGRGYCRLHYKRWYKTGDPRLTLWKVNEESRFWSKVEKKPWGCWIWTGATHDGYGWLTVDSKNWLAHRRAWYLVKGEQPPGILDHLCRVPPCVNPEHLEGVTMQENIRRGRPNNADKMRELTHCMKGHPLSGDNLYVYPKTGYRSCRICRRHWREKHEHKKRAAVDCS